MSAYPIEARHKPSGCSVGLAMPSDRSTVTAVVARTTLTLLLAVTTTVVDAGRRDLSPQPPFPTREGGWLGRCGGQGRTVGWGIPPPEAGGAQGKRVVGLSFAAASPLIVRSAP